MQNMSKSLPQLKIINRLHVLRAERRITQEQLAKEIGVTRATIVAIEGATTTPRLSWHFALRAISRQI